MLKRQNPATWTPAQAAHLLNRAGFGGPPEEIATLHRLGLPAAVDRLLAGDEDDDLFPPPALLPPAEIFARFREMQQATDAGAKRDLQMQRRKEEGQQMRSLRSWWLERMRYTTHPAREKMTLFWHGHFATSMEKVNLAYLMWQQNETLRANALGNFRALTRQISRDPAMMRYLDLARSERGKPNENFARELMELFTLGEGVRYTEHDIRESARAFTGYRIDPRTQAFAYRARQADQTEKMFMGRMGNFGGDDVIDIILDQPEASKFIAHKLWVFLASEKPPKDIVENVAVQLRGSNYDVRATLREIFLSEAFYAPEVMHSQVKSPVQWIVQTARVLEAPLPSGPALEASLNQMGQVLFAPPNVKGWDGGRAWISSASLLYRYNLAGYIVSGKAPASPPSSQQ